LLEEKEKEGHGRSRRAGLPSRPSTLSSGIWPRRMQKKPLDDDDDDNDDEIDLDDESLLCKICTTLKDQRKNQLRQRLRGQAALMEGSSSDGGGSDGGGGGSDSGGSQQ